MKVGPLSWKERKYSVEAKTQDTNVVITRQVIRNIWHRYVMENKKMEWINDENSAVLEFWRTVYILEMKKPTSVMN
jgi:hypothetical protein